MPKTVLITGANKSIGYETARRLGELGYRVWLGARDAQRGEAAAHALRDFGHTGHRTVEQAAEIIVQLATSEDAGQTGKFLNARRVLPW